LEGTHSCSKTFHVVEHLGLAPLWKSLDTRAPV